MAKVMPLSLTFSCFGEILIGSTFLVLAYPGNPIQNQESHKTVVCVCVIIDRAGGMHRDTVTDDFTSISADATQQDCSGS